MIVVLIGAGVAAIFWGSSGMVDVSDAFFKATAAGNIEQARTYLAEDFRKSTSEDELHSFLQNSALLDYAEAHWSSRAINMGGTGHLEGTVNTKSGGSVPLTIQFVKENDVWKIYSIRKSQAGLVTASDAESPAAPSLADSRKIALATTLVFGNAVKTGDFTAIYQTTSSEFQKKYTAATFASSFAELIDRKIDSAVAPDAVPVFTTAPEMLENGVLHMAGSFDRSGQEHGHLIFNYKYVYRHTEWKLVGIDVKITGIKADVKGD